MIRTVLIALGLVYLAACSGHYHQAPAPASPQGYTACDPTNAPELCAPPAAIQAQAPQPPTCDAVALPAWNIDCDDTTWSPLPAYDGHTGCYVLVGDTSYAWCQDGGTPFAETS